MHDTVLAIVNSQMTIRVVIIWEGLRGGRAYIDNYRRRGQNYMQIRNEMSPYTRTYLYGRQLRISY